MKQYHTTALGTLAFLVSALLAPATHAGPTNVPLKATLNVQEQLGALEKCTGSNGQSPGPGGTISGAGQASHLGAVTIEASHCIAPADSNRLVIYRGEMTLIAASGDRATGLYSGTLTTTAPGVFRFDGNFHITGGTGRFDDANGNGQLSGVYYGDPRTGVISGTLTANGRVSY